MGASIYLGKSLSAGTKGCNIVLASTTPASPLLLDTYTGAAVAYSLRQLRTAYTGAAIRVRRSSDNAEQDINFVGGDLDTQSLLDFVGYNLWTYSEDISNGVWTKGNLNTTGTPPYLDVETAPDGLTTGDKLIENTATNTHSILRTNSVTSGLEYNVSVYLKQAERTKVQISSSISNSAQTCDVDLTNGTISNNGFANTPVVTSEANGWYRFSITITAGTTGSYNTIRINLYNDSNATNYTGDGTSGAYVWGFQLTKSSSVLTYGKTGASVTKDAYITTWYDQSGNALNIVRPVATQQPKIVSSGVVEVKNLKSTITFDGTDDVLAYSSPISAINSGNEFSIYSVHHNNITGVIRTFWTNSASGSNQMRGFGDTRTSSPLNFFISNSAGTNYTSTLSTVRNNTDQRLQVSVMDSGNVMRGFDNGATGGTATYTLTYANAILQIGNGANGALNGGVQEFIIFDTNQLSNRTAIETNINDYYSIY